MCFGPEGNIRPLAGANARAALMVIAGAGRAGIVASSVSLYRLAGAFLAATIAAHNRLCRMTRGITGEALGTHRLQTLLYGQLPRE